MMKKFALLFALLVMPAVGFAQDGAAPPAPVPVPEADTAVVVGQGCTNCGSSAVASGCSSCGTASSCDPCARPARVRVLTRRKACCQPAAASCCTPAPAPCCTPAPAAPACGCAAAPADCCNTAVASCTPATRTRLFARNANSCATTSACSTCSTTSACSTSAPVATDCGCSSVASVSAPATVAQVSYVSECGENSVRPSLRPFGGNVLRRTR
jgi:hypothetical protein